MTSAAFSSRNATAWPIVTPGARAALTVAAFSWFIWVSEIGRASVFTSTRFDSGTGKPSCAST